MSEPSEDWNLAFPTPQIPSVLSYIAETWAWIVTTYNATTTFDHQEPELTDNLCQALDEPARRQAKRMSCAFNCEKREIRRGPDGSTVPIARADIEVVLGTPATPRLIIEFKKIDGTVASLKYYCFGGISRFVEGKYSVDHAHGVMCAFSPNDPATESSGIATYIEAKKDASELQCEPIGGGDVVRRPSSVAPAEAFFETKHLRPVTNPTNPITLLHTVLACPPAVPKPPALKKVKKPGPKATKARAQRAPKP